MVDSLNAGTVDLSATGVVDPLRPTIVVVKTLILLSGGAIGFGLVTLGALLPGAVDRVLTLSRTLALVVERAFTAGGFAVILWSLFHQ